MSVRSGGFADLTDAPTLLRALTLVAVTLVCGAYFVDRSRVAREISAQDFGPEWPWPSVNKAVLQCRIVKDAHGMVRPMVQVALNGSVYALNSTAIEATGGPDSRQLMADASGDPAGVNGRRQIIRMGRSICGLPRNS